MCLGCLTDAVLCPGKHERRVAEWRLAGAGGGAQVPWTAVPAVAEAIAGWIADQTESHPGQVLLLAARMPQEIAVDLGIHLAQRESSWPGRLYPVHYDGGELVMPKPGPGRGSVRPERD
jgi:hypothetical protein